MLTKLKLLGLLMVLILLGSTVVVVAGGINVRNPEDIIEQDASTIIVPPPLFPPNQKEYVEHPLDKPIIAPDNRPVAQFAPVDNLADRIDVFLPDIPSEDADEIAYGVLASIKYSKQSHFVLVTTVHPTASAARQTQVLGEQTVNLANGQTAWITTDTEITITDSESPLQVKNQITWIKDDLLISVGSDLPIEEIQELATNVVIE